ncbi:MAG: helix-turn-helix transcriptional regulator [Planctomycetota bacterium]
MYQHSFSLANRLSDLAGLCLYIVWRVHGDPTYVVDYDYSSSTSKSLRTHGGTGLIGIRTRKGCGEVVLSNGKSISLPKDTFVLLTWSKLSRYRCLDAQWQFWWFEFSLSGLHGLPLCEPLHIPAHRGETGELEFLFIALRSEKPFVRRQGVATFARLLYSWLARWEGESAPSRYAEPTHDLIELFHRDPGRRWTVSRMARHVQMSERNFRRMFLKILGEPPQRFLRDLRLSAAENLLRFQKITVGEAAEKLGFSDAFHLSRLFRQRFGYSPSQKR